MKKSKIFGTSPFKKEKIDAGTAYKNRLQISG